MSRKIDSTCVPDSTDLGHGVKIYGDASVDSSLASTLRQSTPLHRRIAMPKEFDRLYQRGTTPTYLNIITFDTHERA